MHIYMCMYVIVELMNSSVSGLNSTSTYEVVVHINSSYDMLACVKIS
jgi:hypothetical protein